MDNPKQKTKYSVLGLFRRLIPFCKPYRFWIGLCLGGSILDTVIGMSEAYFVKNLINAALDYYPDQLWRSILIMAGTVVVGTAVTYYLKFFYGFFSSSMLRDLRLFLVNHIQNLGVPEVEGRHSGDLLSRMTGDIAIVQRFIGKDFLSIFLQGILFIGAAAYMATIHWQLLLVSIMLTPPCLWVLDLLNKPVRQNAKKAQEYLGMATAVLKDTIGGIYMMKAFNIYDYLYGRFRRNVYDTLEMYLKNIRISVWNSPVHVTLRMIPRVIGVTYGGYLVVQGKITPGELISFIFLLGFVTWPLAFLPDLINSTKTAMGAFERLMELMDQPEERQGGNLAPGYTGSRILSCEQLNFSYDGTTEVLKNLSFTLERGRKLALVGPSGSGKTTVFKLICGFYSGQAGTIKFYEQDTRDWDLNALRSQIALVSQDIYLFPASVYENIAYGKPNASREEVVAAARVANAHDFIMELPDGYDSAVGERGIRLSGGQKQRIAIARAVLKDAPVLLLDEPTSALDTYSESLVQEALNRVMHGRTVLVVAHRLSTIKDADEVLVMDQGRIVERGTHEALLEAGGVYQHLYLRQFETADCSRTA